MKVKRMKETMLGGTMWLQLITRQNMLKNHLKNSWFIKKKKGEKRVVGHGKCEIFIIFR